MLLFVVSLNSTSTRYIWSMLFSIFFYWWAKLYVKFNWDANCFSPPRLHFIEKSNSTRDIISLLYLGVAWPICWSGYCAYLLVFLQRNNRTHRGITYHLQRERVYVRIQNYILVNARNYIYFIGLCSSNIPRYFLDFACHCSIHSQILRIQVYIAYYKQSQSTCSFISFGCFLTILQNHYYDIDDFMF